jgi:hypothetical protein
LENPTKRNIGLDARFNPASIIFAEFTVEISRNLFEVSPPNFVKINHLLASVHLQS